MIGTTLLYRKGYFEQEFNKEKWQIEKPALWQPEQELTLLPNKVSVAIKNRDVHIRTWVYELSGLSGYSIPIYFLDTDIESNHPEDRQLSWYLYGGITSIAFPGNCPGVGGLRMLRDLDITILKLFISTKPCWFLTLELIGRWGTTHPEKVKELWCLPPILCRSCGHDFFKYDS